MLPNLLAYPVTFLGALRAGLIVVNVNPLYTPRELKAQLIDCGATAIVIMENFAHKLEQVLRDTQVRHVIVARLGDFMPPIKRAVFNFANTYVRKAVPAWRFESFALLHKACGRAPGAHYADAAPGPTSPALLQYTGGTTGVAKGAILTHRNLIANTLQCRAVIGPYLPEEQGSVLTPLPLYHIFSLTANCLVFMSVGGENVLITNPRDIPRFVKEMRRLRFTAMTGVNTLFNALLNNPKFAHLDFRSFRLSLGGGMAVQEAVAKRWKEVTGVTLVEAYGLTETSPAATMNPLDATEYTGAIGLPIPSTWIVLRDDAGRDVPLGEPGEICIKGPQVMAGYWQRPQDTADVMTPDGFFMSGDIGTMDARGYIRIVDRKKDMILVSGFNVYPNEIEGVVAQHPGVLECAAVGVPDPKSGEAVKLFVVRKDATLTAAGVVAHCRDHLTAYKCPRDVEFRGDLPKSNVGKILRRELRDEAKRSTPREAALQ
jgi:long-chain acyl-CoA synthetase